ncbi:MAG: hypothetical protein ACFE9M_14000 [Promethearchaeota archaeon]
MMIESIKSRKRTKDTLLGFNDEEYSIAQGCCFFHNEDELKSFDDIDDDNDIQD